MKVIYAGLSKTGTKTMNAALTELGYNCYDYMENFTILGDEWMKIFKEGGTTEDFRRMFENVDAVMDMPCCVFWEEIHKAFPDAKIIFSMRENEDIWYRSQKNQLDKNERLIFKLMTLLSPSYWRFGKYMITSFIATYGLEYKLSFFSEYKCNEMILKKCYRTHNNYVLENAPKDKLLVINYDDGWEPLCEFLGHPVPNIPFPHKNKKGSFSDELKTHPYVIRMHREVMISGSLLVGLLGFGIYKLATRPSDSASLLSYVTSPVNTLLGQFGR